MTAVGIMVAMGKLRWIGGLLAVGTAAMLLSTQASQALEPDAGIAQKLPIGAEDGQADFCVIVTGGLVQCPYRGDWSLSWLRSQDGNLIKGALKFVVRDHSVLGWAASQPCILTSSRLDCGSHQPEAFVGALDVAANADVTCAINSTKMIKCWDTITGAPLPAPAGGSWDSVAVGGNDLACAISEDRRARCWWGLTGVAVNLFENDRLQSLSIGSMDAYTILDNRGFDHATVACGVVIGIEDSPSCAIAEPGFPPFVGFTFYSSITSLVVGRGFVCTVDDQNTLLCWRFYPDVYRDRGIINGQFWVPKGLKGDFLEVSAPPMSYELDSVCGLTSQNNVICSSDRNGPSGVGIAPFPGPPETPEVTVAQSTNGYQVDIQNAGFWSRTPTIQTWPTNYEVLDALSGVTLCETSVKPSGYGTGCYLPKRKIGTYWAIRAVGKSEFGISDFSQTVHFRVCPFKEPTLTVSTSPTALARGQVWRISGSVRNTCDPLPKALELRSRSSGEGWGAWKSVPLNKFGNWSSTQKVDQNSFAQVRVNVKGLLLTSQVQQVQVAPRKSAFEVSMTTSRTAGGFQQGGSVHFKFESDPDFDGVCGIGAETGSAFNFALTRMGSEREESFVNVKKGMASGTLNIRWNGQFKVVMACKSPKFKSVIQTRILTFKAKF